MSAKYSELGSTDDSTVAINIDSSREQELTSTKNSSDSHSHSHSHSNGEKCNGDHSHSGHSHSHGGHSHGHEGHSHGPGESCGSKKRNNGIIFMRFFTMFMPFNCIMLQQFWLNETLVENKFEHYGSTLFMWLILFMCNVTYYQAVTIKNSVVQRAPPQADPSCFDPVMRNNQTCKDCNYWKPMRTKHCRQCGTCNLRMDHHCPWITNCVGLRNNRAFVLFTIYMAAGATQYCYRTLMYFYFLNSQENFWQNSSFFYLYWLLTTIILVPICIMLIGLSFFHTFLLTNNATTLDTMGGLQLGLPFSPQQRVDPSKRTINIFNRGLISNVRDFFSGDIFFWWWPRQTYTKNDGTLYSMAPPITFNDIQNYVKRTQFSEDGMNLSQTLFDFEKKIEDEKARLKECNMQVGDRIYEMWKDIANEEMAKEQKELAKAKQNASSATEPTKLEAKQLAQPVVAKQVEVISSEIAFPTQVETNTEASENDRIVLF